MPCRQSLRQWLGFAATPPASIRTRQTVAPARAARNFPSVIRASGIESRVSVRIRTSPGPAPPDRVSAVWRFFSPPACLQSNRKFSAIARSHVDEYTIVAREATMARQERRLCPAPS